MGIIGDTLRRFTIGQKAGQDVVAELENGKPKADQVYRGMSAARAFLCYLYVCACGGETGVPGGRFAYLDCYRCSNCAKPFCVADWLKRDMANARKLAGNDSTKPFSLAEEQDAEARLPYRLIGGGRRQQSRWIDPGDPKNGSTGVYDYDGQNPGSVDDPFSGGVGFADPHSTGRRSVTTVGEQRVQGNDYDRAVEHWRKPKQYS